MKQINKFFKGFYYAYRGLISGFKERNMKFHGIATAAVLIFGLILGLSKIEWFTVLILIGVIWSAELVNTSIEELANIIKDHEGLDYYATTRTRDIAAASVLILAIIAAIIGLIIFVPKFLIIFLG